MQAPARENARAGLVAAYALAYAAMWLALLTPVIVTLSLRIQRIAPRTAPDDLSLVLGVGALVALISNPVFGYLSDRTRSRFGQRKPWLVGGMVGGLVALALIGSATTVPMVLIGWCLAQLAFNAALAAMMAVLPDYVPVRQRGTVSGLLGVCIPAGQIAGTFIVQELAGNMLLALLVPATIGLIAVLWLTFVLPDASPWQLMEASSEPTARSALPSIRRHPDFQWAWLSRVFFVMGAAFLTAYQPLFLIDALSIDVRDVPHLIFRSTLVHSGMLALWSLIAGWLSDSTGRRKFFVFVGAALQAVGLCLIATADSYSTFIAAVALTGTGHGIYVGVDLALVTEVLPDQRRDAARDLGILNITNTLPQVIAPAAAPFILGLTGGDYALLFIAAGCAASLGSLFILPLRNVR